jgi:hypothetical protein
MIKRLAADRSFAQAIGEVRRPPVAKHVQLEILLISSGHGL